MIIIEKRKQKKVTVTQLFIYFIFVAHLSSYHEKAINALYELAYELPAICLPHQDGGIPLRAFPNGTTSELAGLLSTFSF